MSVKIRFLIPDELERGLRCAAIVSALVDCWRDFQFKPDVGDGRRSAVWRDHAGNYAYMLFAGREAVLLGFDHESPMSPHAFATGPDDFRPWPGVYDQLPAKLFEDVRQTAFTADFDHREITFCLWNEAAGELWAKGLIEYPERCFGDPDGSRYILGRLSSLCRQFENKMREHYSTRFGNAAEREHGAWMRPELQQLLFSKLSSGERFTTDETRQLVHPDCDLAVVEGLLVSLGAA
jgi:hypothetical protein